MTREEAIQSLKDILEEATSDKDAVCYVTSEDAEALNMAIEALQTDTEDKQKGKWVLDPNGMDWNLPAWRCSECGFVANHIGVEANGIGNNPMNWAGSKFCPNCGVHMIGGTE